MAAAAAAAAAASALAGGSAATAAAAAAWACRAWCAPYSSAAASRRLWAVFCIGGVLRFPSTSLAIVNHTCQPSSSSNNNKTQAGPAASASSSLSDESESDADASASADASATDSGLLEPAEWRRRHAMEVFGEEPPAPYQTFEQTGFPAAMLRAVREQGGKGMLAGRSGAAAVDFQAALLPRGAASPCCECTLPSHTPLTSHIPTRTPRQ